MAKQYTEQQVKDALGEFEVGNTGYVGEEMHIRNRFRKKVMDKLKIKDERIDLSDVQF